ncbi:MAG: acyltransferase [Bacteroidetes bacterium]|nr:acyltransferase [Bacteroidota bacterium]
MNMTETAQRMKKGSAHIEILDFLRGIAALSVVLFHFSGSALPTIKPNALTDFFSWGKLGVQVFFVISGFIIPYAMYASGYNIKNAFKFIGKRLIRIGPPAWIAVLLLFIIYYGAIAMNGKPVEGMPWPGISFEATIANLFFSYSLIGTGLYNEVYWTLEVEFQYYVIIAFLLPVLLKYAKNELALTAILLAVNATYLIHFDRILFFQNNSFFLLGILLFLYKTGHIKRGYMGYATIVMMLICYAQQGLPNAFAAIITFLTIAYVQFTNPVTTFLGKISYSLYITHHFAGITAEFILRNLTGLQVSEPLKVVMVLVYTGIAILFAWIFYLLIETPSLRLAQKIKLTKYKNN